MFIKSLSLEHIRSYEKATIDFSVGTTLLAGDIGSGKTSILLALEFALFGILRGKTSPQEFLSHDALQGKVTLFCELQGKDVIISRSIKRTRTGIVQLPGEIQINGEKETLVPTELKAKILTLLGYPESLLAKSTNLFRYTVYTPQEQVKMILFESSDERKDVIRKIFALDKYKIIQENITHYITSLRERTEHLKGQTDDVKTLTQQLHSYKTRLQQFTKELPHLEENEKRAVLEQKKAKEALEKMQKEKTAQEKLLASLTLAKQKLQGEKDFLQDYILQEQNLKEKIQLLEKDKPPKDFSEIASQEEKIKQALLVIADRKVKLHQKYGELIKSDKQAKNLINNISQLTTCPVCQQEVHSQHKEHISQEQGKIIAENNKKRVKLQSIEATIVEKEKKILLLQQTYQKKQIERALYLRQQKELEQNQQQIMRISEKISHQKKILTQDALLVTRLQKEIATLKNISDEKEKEQIKKTDEQARLTSKALNQVKGQVKILLEEISILEKTLEEKEKIEQSIAKLSSLKTWLTELFLPLLVVMEKKILLKIYQEFNAHFIQWFDQLLPDESLEVKLDEDFTPVIIQNGYDTSVMNLSGGEKTSVALAYRLALNKVLNDYFSSIYTKGLLILDEPTDGFSSEQLDRLRDVLLEIGVKQIIIVSHEQKLESLADHILRVEKTGMYSQIRTF